MIPSAAKPQTSHTAFPANPFNNGLQAHQPRYLPVGRLIVAAAFLTLTFYAIIHTAVPPAFSAGSTLLQSAERRPVFSLPALCATFDIQGPEGPHALQCAQPASR